MKNSHNTPRQYTTRGAPRTTNTEKLTVGIADQAARLHDLVSLMDDAKGTRSGNASSIALILKDVSLRLYEIAYCTDAERLAALAQ